MDAELDRGKLVKKAMEAWGDTVVWERPITEMRAARKLRVGQAEVIDLEDHPEYASGPGFIAWGQDEKQLLVLSVDDEPLPLLL